MKYKKGDKLRITHTGKGGSCHGFKVGDAVTVRYTEENGEIHCSNLKEYFYIYEDEAEPYTEPFDITPPEDAPPTKRELHRRICEELNTTYVKKNTDYGDSYGQLRARYPNSILIRVFDKFSRLERLLKGNRALVEDESVEDTLLDMANYCIMEVVERRLSK